MITAGVDVGTRFIKVCLTDGESLRGSACAEMGPHFDAIISFSFKGSKSSGTGGKMEHRKDYCHRLRRSFSEESRLYVGRSRLHRQKQPSFLTATFEPLSIWGDFLSPFPPLIETVFWRQPMSMKDAPPAVASFWKW